MKSKRKIDESKKDEVVSLLTKFNRWRRQEGEYDVQPDGSFKTLDLSPFEIGKAIDFAIQYMKEH